MSAQTRNQPHGTPRIRPRSRGFAPDHFPARNGFAAATHSVSGLVANGHGKRPRILFVTDFYLEQVLAGAAGYAQRAGWDLNANMRFHALFPSDADADGILATVVGQKRVQEW